MLSSRLLNFGKALPSKSITERLRVLRLGKTEHHVVAVIAAQGVRQRCRRQRLRSAMQDFAVLGPLQPVSRESHMMRPPTLKVGPSDFALTVGHLRCTA